VTTGERSVDNSIIKGGVNEERVPFRISRVGTDAAGQRLCQNTPGRNNISTPDYIPSRYHHSTANHYSATNHHQTSGDYNDGQREKRDTAIRRNAGPRRNCRPDKLGALP
jgi:hypothetical protein